MATRIKTAAGMAVVFIAVMFLSGTPVLNIAVAAVAVISLDELYRVTLQDAPKWLRIPGLVFAVLYHFHPYIDQISNASLVYVLMLVLFILLLKHHDELHIQQVSMAFTLAYLVTVTISSVLTIRQMPGGEYLVWLVCLIPWASDSLAYFGGRAFGKRKMCPTISPHKTVAGGISGMLGGIVVASIFCWAMHMLGQEIQHVVALFVVSFLCSAISEMGDLCASVIKRQYQCKDYGSIFPGHGGMMDRFDSVFFVAPVLYYFFIFFPIFPG